MTTNKYLPGTWQNRMYAAWEADALETCPLGVVWLAWPASSSPPTFCQHELSYRARPGWLPDSTHHTPVAQTGPDPKYTEQGKQEPRDGGGALPSPEYHAPYVEAEALARAGKQMIGEPRKPITECTLTPLEPGALNDLLFNVPEQVPLIWLVDHREHPGDVTQVHSASSRAKAEAWMRCQTVVGWRRGYFGLSSEVIDGDVHQTKMLGFYTLTGEPLEDQPCGKPTALFSPSKAWCAAAADAEQGCIVGAGVPEHPAEVAPNWPTCQMCGFPLGSNACPTCASSDCFDAWRASSAELAELGDHSAAQGVEIARLQTDAWDTMKAVGVALGLPEPPPIEGAAPLQSEWKGKLSEKVLALRQERDAQAAEIAEYADLVEKLSGLLIGTANALKGDPGPLVRHDWSDLPAVAAKARADAAQEACADVGGALRMAQDAWKAVEKQVVAQAAEIAAKNAHIANMYELGHAHARKQTAAVEAAEKECAELREKTLADANEYHLACQEIAQLKRKVGELEKIVTDCIAALRLDVPPTLLASTVRNMHEMLGQDADALDTARQELAAMKARKVKLPTELREPWHAFVAAEELSGYEDSLHGVGHFIDAMSKRELSAGLEFLREIRTAGLEVAE